MITVLIVDDEALVRAGIRMILAPVDDIEVVAEAADGAEALAAIDRDRPDVVLMDVRMPGMDGLTALRETLRRPTPPQVIMLTTFDMDEYVHGALHAGAAGFLLKDTPPRDLAAAVRTVAEGHAMLAPSVTRRLIDAYSGQPPVVGREARRRLAALTPRERDVIAAVALGLSNSQIAGRLGMTETTVKAHVSRSLTKLGLSNRVQLALLVRDAESG